MLSKYHFAHQGRIIALTLLLTLLAGLIGAAPLFAAPPAPDQAAALTWIRSQQQPDGGFSGGMTAGSDIGTTSEVILAAVAAGEKPTDWRTGDHSPLDYLSAQVQSGTVVTNAAALSRIILATVAVDQDPRNFGGRNLVQDLLQSHTAGNAQFGDSLYAHSYALLALANAGEPLPEDALNLLLAPRPKENGWAMLGGTADDSSDTNTTALAIQALVAAGKTDVAHTALPYLHQAQNSDGGFPWQKPSPYGTDSDANSTAVVLQALNALGEKPADWAPGGITPLQALENFWNPETKSYRWQAAVPNPNLIATAQAIQARNSLSLIQVKPVNNSLPAYAGLVIILGCISIAAAGVAYYIRKNPAKK